MHPLQQQISDLRKYHDALGTKLASLERHLDPEHEDDRYDAVANKRADEVLQAPTKERQNYTVSSDGSVMHEGKRYSFKYSGAAIENVLILKAYPLIIQHADGVFYTEAITNVREVKEPAKEWEIVEFKCIGKWDGKEGGLFVKNKEGIFISETRFAYTEFSMLHGSYGSVKDGQFAIHAVRRLSDGTVWRVGTITTNGRITGFEIKDINMMVSMDNGYSYPISLLTEAKALFTTADGVGVFSTQTRLWWLRCVNGNVADIWEGIEQVWVDMPDRINDIKFWKPFAYRIYSNREAAQSAYDKWLFEQPVLTLRDLEFRGISGHQWGILKQFVKDKISKK